MRNTVMKLFREHHSRMGTKDKEIIAYFEKNTSTMMDQSLDLQVDLKRLYDKRKKMIEDRN